MDTQTALAAHLVAGLGVSAAIFINYTSGAYELQKMK